MLYRWRLRHIFTVVVVILLAALIFSADCCFAVNYEGKPKIKDDGDYGYYLWRDNNKVWHIVTITGDTPHTFSGEIILTRGEFDVVEKEEKGIVETIFKYVSRIMGKEEEANKKKGKLKKEREKRIDEKEKGEKWELLEKKIEGTDVDKSGDKVLKDDLKGREVSVVNERKIEFSFNSKDEKKGFNFKVKGNSPCVIFDLMIDGKRNIRRIYIGENNVRPRHLPINKCR
ncbi:MAG: hypothetical protein JW984_12290 [Deltaproteobacteria bacterium]|uniref:Uncharacterized protein n=1 Tax=Candidatus Zymogenus saltonus TaxID=2844893 RepID=A0A9D8KFT9_9DELT|nr:hypothetical protein [Candidatus Zymogenus saltonus]